MPVRKRLLTDPEDETFVASLTQEQRVMMVWQLSLQAYAFKEGLDHEPRLRRDVVRTIRGER